MKTAFNLLLVMGALLTAPAVRAQYTIDRSVIAAGGGTSTNGNYSLSGTIGQPAAGGPLTNGGYSVTGGFWALPVAVQTEGAPRLSIAAAPGGCSITWSPATPGFVLQSCGDLAAKNWTNAPSGATNPVVIPAAAAARYYRLSK